MDIPEWKQALVDAVRANVEERLATALAAADSAREDLHVGGERTRTRGERGTLLETTYLLSAQVRQADTYREQLRALATLDLSSEKRSRAGSLLAVTSPEEEVPAAPPAEDAGTGGLPPDLPGEGATLYFLLPGADGETVTFSGREIHLVSPLSPLGQALGGRRAGGRAVVRLPGGERNLRVLAVY